MMERLKSLGNWISGHQWAVFVVAVSMISFVLTSVSLWLYQTSGTVKLDLSRPGYEKVRKEVKDNNDSTKPFPPTGNLDDAALKDFRSRYNTIKLRLDQMNNYDNTVISDENLGLITDEEI